MPISDNFSDFIRRYKEAHALSISELAEELAVAKSAIEGYLNGCCNPRADTIDHIAEKCGVTAAEIISAQPPGWEQAEIIARTAKLFCGLPPERKGQAVQLFLALMDILSEEEYI